MREDFDALCNQLAGEVMSGMKEWRLHYSGNSKPKWNLL